MDLSSVLNKERKQKCGRELLVEAVTHNKPNDTIIRSAQTLQASVRGALCVQEQSVQARVLM